MLTDRRRLAHLLAASSVPRWAIVPGVLPQTVGSHSFNVALLAWWLITGGGKREDRPGIAKSAMVAAIWHDVSECLTGDIPHPAKKMWPNLLGAVDHLAPSALGTPPSVSPHPAVKIADLLDAIRQLRLSGHAHDLRAWAYAGLCRDLVALEERPEIWHEIDMDAYRVAKDEAFGEPITEPAP